MTQIAMVSIRKGTRITGSYKGPDRKASQVSFEVEAVWADANRQPRLFGTFLGGPMVGKVGLIYALRFEPGKFELGEFEPSLDLSTYVVGTSPLTAHVEPRTQVSDNIMQVYEVVPADELAAKFAQSFGEGETPFVVIPTLVE